MSDNDTAKTTVFISYAREDSKAAERLYNELKKEGFKLWLDKHNIIAGQDWQKEIRNAIKNSRYFISLFSSSSVKKIGYVQNEFKYALEVFESYPPGIIFYIPVRLDDCDIPYQELGSIHRVDLFPEDKWKEGINSIIRALKFDENNDKGDGNTDTGSTVPPITRSLQQEDYKLLKPLYIKGNPYGIAIDKNDNMYVSFSKTKTGFIKPKKTSSVMKFNNKGEVDVNWGSEGLAKGIFNNPHGIAVDSLGFLYVVDDHYIQKFDYEGNLKLKWPSTNSNIFNNPHGIAVDSKGCVYVADTNNRCIQKFDNNGNFLTKIENYFGYSYKYYPFDITIDSKCYVYVIDTINGRLFKINRNGEFLVNQNSLMNFFGELKFHNPHGIAVDSQGYIYIVDDHYIQKISKNGKKIIFKWGGSEGSGDTHFNNPHGIAVDSKGCVYVADTFNERIQIFSPSS